MKDVIILEFSRKNPVLRQNFDVFLFLEMTMLVFMWQTIWQIMKWRSITHFEDVNKEPTI